MDRSRLAIAAIVVLVLGGFAWIATRPVDGPSPDDEVETSMERTLRPGIEIPEVEPSAVAGESGQPAPETIEVRKLPPAAPPEPVDLASADRQLDLFGVVVNEADRPVAGAELQTILYPGRRLATFDPDDYTRKEEGPSTRSASDGTFRLRLGKDEVVDLKVTAEGYAVTVVSMSNAGEQVRVVLGPPCEARVDVRDMDGKPVAGARVKLWLMSGEDWGVAGFQEERKEETDAEGRAVFRDLDEGTGWMQVSHPDHGDNSAQLQAVRGEPTTTEVVLGKGLVLEGLVADAETGAPIVGAEVGGWWGDEEDRYTTGEDGRYRLEGVGGQFMTMIRVTAKGYASQTKSPPQEGELHFDLVRGETAHGIVVDIDGAPVAGAQVSATGMSWSSAGQEMDSAKALSAEDGAFELPGLHGTIEHTLNVTKRGFGRVTMQLDHTRTVDGRLDLGLIILPRPRRIEGTAVTDVGLPVARAIVTITPTIREESAMMISIQGYGMMETRRTDDLGRFRFPDLSPGPYTLAVRPRGSAETKLQVELPSDRDLLDVRIVVEGGQTVTVLTVDEGGLPISGMYVYAYGVGLDSGANIITDSDGRAILRGLPDSTVTISVWGSERYINPDPQEVKPRGQEVRFTMKQAATIKGHVRDAEGKAVPAMQIQIIGPDGPLTNTFGWSNVDGSFSIPLEPGLIVDLKVAGAPADFMPSPGQDQEKKTVRYYTGEVRGVSAPATDVVIQVAEAASDRTLTVKVIGPKGEPISGAMVQLWGMNYQASQEMQHTGEDGRLRLEGLPPMQLYLNVTAGPDSKLPPDAMNQKSMQVIPEGQEVVIQFESALVIQGRVVDGDGNPASGVSIQAGPDMQPVAYAATDEEGNFSIKVPAGGGPYRLKATRFVDNEVSTGSVDGVAAPAEGVVIVLGKG